MGNKRAIVLGSTGLVGTALVKELVADSEYSEIVLIRRKKGDVPSKCRELIIDFDDPETYKTQVTGDVLFSAFGTTIAKAGSQEAQRRIDVDYQYNIAQAAAENGVERYALVSALGADQKSRVFYNRIKGELEQEVRKLPFQSITIVRPSVLAGKRKEKRMAERFFIWLGLNVMPYIPIVRRFRAVRDSQVARIMIHSEKDGAPFRLIRNHEIFAELKKITKDDKH